MSTTLTFDTPRALSAFAKVVAQEVVAISQPKKDRITQRQAYIKFGKTWVDRHTLDGKLQALRNGEKRNSPVYYSLAECTALREWEKQLLTAL